LEQLQQAGVPEFVSSIVVNFALDTTNQQFAIKSNDLEKLPGRKPSTWKDGLQEVFKL